MLCVSVTCWAAFGRGRIPGSPAVREATPGRNGGPHEPYNRPPGPAWQPANGEHNRLRRPADQGHSNRVRTSALVNDDVSRVGQVEVESVQSKRERRGVGQSSPDTCHADNELARRSVGRSGDD